MFDPDQVRAVLRRRRVASSSIGPGETAAAAFELFDRGVQLRTVVQEIRQTPDAVDELYGRWLDMGGGDLVIGSAARAELERFVGTFSDVAELVQRVVHALGERIDVTLTEATPHLERASDAEVERAIVGYLDAQADGRLADATPSATTPSPGSPGSPA